MNCNGFEYPYKNKINFDIVAFGANGKGKFQVTSSRDKARNMIKLEKIDLYMPEGKSFKVV